VEFHVQSFVSCVAVEDPFRHEPPCRKHVSGGGRNPWSPKRFAHVDNTTRPPPTSARTHVPTYPRTHVPTHPPVNHRLVHRHHHPIFNSDNMSCTSSASRASRNSSAEWLREGSESSSDSEQTSSQLIDTLDPPSYPTLNELHQSRTVASLKYTDLGRREGLWWALVQADMRGVQARGVAYGGSKKEAKREAAERCCLDLSARILASTKGQLSELLPQVTSANSFKGLFQRPRTSASVNPSFRRPPRTARRLHDTISLHPAFGETW
jgi:hypothetical protein